MSNSTISAISTAFGKGGIAVIRISGDDSLRILDDVFKPKSQKNVEDYPPNKMIYGNIIKDGRIIDDAMAVRFAAPHSFTGEDSAELYIHGGILLSQLVLEATFKAGAVPARPGEFTERAFLSGKLGLTQAEAIIDLIDAESEEKAVFASRGIGGVLSKELQKTYDTLVALVSSIYAYIDYPDEDLTDVPVDEMKQKLSDIRDKIAKIKNTYRTGKAVCEGIPTAICGKANTGKSSLLNLMLGEQRAIVTDIAGTTRDTVEETVNCGKVLLRLCDTAGIRQSDDTVEKIGIEKALEKLDSSDLIFAMFDNSSPLDDDDLQFIERLKSQDGKTVVILLNKSDLGTVADRSLFEKLSPYVLEICANDPETKNDISTLIESIFIDGKIDYDKDGVITNARQNACLERVLSRIDEAKAALENGFTQDIAGIELESALSELAGIDGRTVTDDVVKDIFSRFCVGK